MTVKGALHFLIYRVSTQQMLCSALNNSMEKNRERNNSHETTAWLLD